MKKLASLFVTFTFGMAVLSLPTLALAQAVSVKLESPGELSGAGVVVPVTVACVANSAGADLEVRLIQILPSGGTGSTGEGYLNLATGECGSTPQIIHVLVRSDSDSPFSVGEGAAGADLDACDSSSRNCNTLSDGQSINVVD
jgi:hypothetical protein